MTPKLRFPGFSGEWGAKKLGDLARKKLSNGVFNDPTKVGSGYRLVNVKDMYVESFIDREKLTKVEISANEFNRNKVEHGDIFFTRSSLVKEGIAYTNIYQGNDGDITYDGHLIKFSPNLSKSDGVFLYYLTKTSRVRRQLVAFGNTTTMTTIGQSEVSSVSLLVPEKDEQEKIAGFLTVVDERIAAMDKKVELLQQYKKGVMQKIFTQKLRFKDENGNGYSAWQTKKLGDIAKIKTGNLNVEDAQSDGKYTFFDRSEEIKSYDEYSFDNEALIYAGEGSEFLPRYFNGKYGLHQRAYSVSDAMGLNMKFLYNFMLTQNNHFLRMAVGSTVKSLRMDCFAKCVVPIPNETEQLKIADVLNSLDDKINLEKTKLEQAKVFKKSLLQRMFV